MNKIKSQSAMGDVVKAFDKKAMAALASAPVSRARNSANSTWYITEKGITQGGNIGGQPGVIIRALASLGGEALTGALVERIDLMRSEDTSVEAIMAGKADQGTQVIVSHYLSNKTKLVKNGFVKVA